MNRLSRFLYILILIMSIPLVSFSQEMKVQGFHVDESDNSANEDATMRFDQNGDICAILKIKTKEKGFTYDVGSLGISGDPDEREGEIWLYVPYGIKRLTLRHQSFGTCEYSIPIAVESGKVYIVRLSTQGGEENSEDQELQITLSPKNATLLVDSLPVNVVNGIYKERLPIGVHSYTVTCEGYVKQEGSIELKTTNSIHRSIILTRIGEDDHDVTVVGKPKEFLVPGTNVRFRMMPVPKSEFVLGTAMVGGVSFEDEMPAHSVELNAFYIGETEVTQELWEAIMGDNPSKYKGKDLPVEQVSWNACRIFLTKLSAVLGQRFRLPTEAEWESAARNGNGSEMMYSGSNELSMVGWYLENSDATTHIVATKEPNALGIYDMNGNVREWCYDLYNDYQPMKQKNPQGAATGSHRVCRGGSWISPKWDCRNQYRDINPPENSDAMTGLRIAM